MGQGWKRLLLLTLSVLATAACSGDNNKQTSTPTLSPTAIPAHSPVPSNVAIDLDLADQLYYEGAYEEALTIYSAAAQNGTEKEQSLGLFSMARIQSQRGENNAAERNIEALLAKSSGGDTDSAAILLLGRAEFAQGDFDEAKAAFEEYISADGPASPYALLFLAQIARQQEQTDIAIDHLNTALLADLPPGQQTDALLALAEAYTKTGDNTSALDAHERAVLAAPDSFETSEALWLLALAAETVGDTPRADNAFERLVVEYPASGRSLEALDRPQVIVNPAIGTRDRAIVLFRHRANAAAEVAFQSISDAGGPGVAEAQYYLGIISERYELWDDALIHYDAAIGLLPTGTNDSLRAQTTWDKATVLELIGRTDEAISAYAAVADALPTHEEAANGGFRAGLLSYQLGRHVDAIAYWKQYLQVAPDEDERARANFWLAKASEALGDTVTADSYYTNAAKTASYDYYSLRARAIIGNVSRFPDVGMLETAASDWSLFEANLEGQNGPEDVIARGALFSGDRWVRALELLDAGLDDRADDELSALVVEYTDEPWLLYRLVRAIDARGRPWISSPAAFTFAQPGQPPEAFRLLYPLEYMNLVQAEADDNGFDPLLLLALVRQESLYDPGAISIANAMGLTQVIPTTADGIAADLDIDDFTYPDLLRPRVSLRFGAYYLGTLLEGFGGLIPPALAGYNGGPGNSGEWWEQAGGDIDLFLESIEFPETRAYVELVMENYALYLYAYGYMPGPSLPL